MKSIEKQTKYQKNSKMHLKFSQFPNKKQNLFFFFINSMSFEPKSICLWISVEYEFMFRVLLAIHVSIDMVRSSNTRKYHPCNFLQFPSSLAMVRSQCTDGKAPTSKTTNSQTVRWTILQTYCLLACSRFFSFLESILDLL